MKQVFIINKSSDFNNEYDRYGILFGRLLNFLYYVQVCYLITLQLTKQSAIMSLDSEAINLFVLLLTHYLGKNECIGYDLGYRATS